MNFNSHSIKDTLYIGKSISKGLKVGDIVCLFGELGSGKTVLTKGIASGLGIEPDKVISPTFILLRRHLNGRLPLNHFDLYRLKSMNDILNLGYEEYFYGDGATVIEWADRLKGITPNEFLKVEILHRGLSQREIKIVAFGRRYEELLKRINEDISR